MFGDFSPRLKGTYNQNPLLTNEFLNVKQFGAKGDGVSNDTAAITAADVAARAVGRALYFPGGIYMATQLTVYTSSWWFGDGRNNSVLSQIIGSNIDFIYGNNSAANWGQTSGITTYVDGYGLFGLTINGGYNSGSGGNTSGSGIAIFGSKPVMRDIFITQCAGYGMRTEWYDVGPELFGMEGHWDDVRISLCGEHGWLMNGPHDSVALGVIISGAGQAATNTWDGLNIGTQGSCTFIGCHTYDANATNHRYAVNDNAGCMFGGGCQFEGGATANAIFNGASRSLIDPSVRFYSNTGTTSIIISQPTTFYGSIEEPYSGTTSLGIKLGVGGDNASDCVIKCNCVNQGNGVIDMTNSQGGNIIDINGYTSAGSGWVGYPNSYDQVVLNVNIAGSFASLRNVVGGVSQFGDIVFANGGVDDLVGPNTTPAGTTQGTATVLSAYGTNVCTTTASGTGVSLPTSSNFAIGRTMLMHNWGANALKVYPESGSQISPLATNAALSIPTLKSALLRRYSATQWGYILSA